MFDLKAAIKNWRAALAAQPGFSDSDMDELEDHLQEEIGALEAAGLATEEAFLVSCRRLGKPEDLSGEFAIADPERRRSFRLSWMITGALAMMFLVLAAEVVTNIGTGTLSRVYDITVFPHGVAGFGWFGVGLRIAMMVVGAILIWRLLATDKSARRLSRFSGWKVIGGAFILVLLALATRTGSRMYVYHGLNGIDNFGAVNMIEAWFDFFAIMILPVLLLVGLWRLVRS